MKKQAKYKVCRRLGPGVYEKCQNEKFALAESRKQAQKKTMRRRRGISDYGRQLMEKQRVRFTYGISERQFRGYVDNAVASKERASQHLFEQLEARLDNVVYRLGLAITRRAARQMVAHGHILVNGKRMKVPSYNVGSKDVITIREGSKNSGLFTDLDERLGEHQIPEWLQYDNKKREAHLLKDPILSEAVMSYDLTSVIEFYSK